MHSRISPRPLVAAALTLILSLALAASAHAAGWQDLGQLSNPGDNAGGSSAPPVTAAAPDGSTWVMWNTNDKLQIVRVAADGSKGPIEDLDSSSPADFTVVPQSNGDALAAWATFGGGVFVREVHAGGTMETTQRVGDTDAEGPIALGISGDDVATVTYAEPGSVTFGSLLWADRVSNNGVPAGSPIQISTNNNDAIDNVALAENPAGDSVISWGFGDVNATSNPWGRGIRRLSATGTVGSEHALGDMQPSSDTSVAPAMLSNGDGSVAYVQITTGGSVGDLKLAKLDAADTLSPVATLDDSAVSSAPAVSLVSNSAGDLTAIWNRFDSNTSNHELASRRIASDGTIAPPLASDPDLFTPSDQDFEGEFALAGMPGGKAVAVWSNEGSTSTTFQASIIDPASGPAAPSTITSSTDENFNVSPAADSAGDIFVAYDLSPDFGSSNTVHGAFYDVQGPIVGTFAVPSGATTGDAMVFGASATDRSGVQGYSWNFGDGGTSTGAIASHTFSTPGTYTVTLTVTDNAGNSTAKTQQVVVRAPGAAAAAPPQAGALNARLAGLHRTMRLGRTRTLTLHLPVQPVDAFGSLSVRAEAGGAARLVTLGSRRFPVFHGKPARLRVKLSAETVKLARRRHGRLKARIRLVLTGFNGNSAGHTYTLTIRIR